LLCWIFLTVSDISGLANVRVLNITECPNIHDFTGLHCLRELIAFHPLVVDSGMETIQQLLTFRTGPESFPSYYGGQIPRKCDICISELTNLTTLELQDWTTLRKFASTLVVYNCGELVSIPA
jgi:hypothetical protein